MTVSAEGRVENQKLNKTAALVSFGWVFGFQLDSLEKNLTTLLGFTFNPGKATRSLVRLPQDPKKKIKFRGALDFTENVLIFDVIWSSFRTQNTPKRKPFKNENNAQTLPKEL